MPKSVTLQASCSPTSTFRAARSRCTIFQRKRKRNTWKRIVAAVKIHTSSASRILHPLVSFCGVHPARLTSSPLRHVSPYRSSYLLWRQEAHPISHLPREPHQLLWPQAGLGLHIRVLVVSVVQSAALPQVTQQVSIRDILDDHHEGACKPGRADIWFIFTPVQRTVVSAGLSSALLAAAIAATLYCTARRAHVLVWMHAAYWKSLSQATSRASNPQFATQTEN